LGVTETVVRHRTRSRGKVSPNLTQLAIGYQQVLLANSHQTEALVGMSLVALASHQNEAAVAMAKAAVAASPQIGITWITLGQVLKAEGRIGEAESAYERALFIDGMDGLAQLGLGELRLSMGLPEAALAHYRLALHRQPTMAAAHLGIGHALASMNRHSEALSHYRQAHELAPHMAECDFCLGFVLARLGRIDEAVEHYRNAIARRSDFAAAWMNLGVLLREHGKLHHAEAALARAVALRPNDVDGWLNLALLLREQRRHPEAEQVLRKAFALAPDNAQVLMACSQLCIARNDLPGAWEWLRWSQARAPLNAEILNLHGILLHHERRLAEAAEMFLRAEELGSLSAASNRGNSLLEMGRIEESLSAHELAVSRNPESAGARYNLALTQLRLGDWANGWKNYESRWRFREVHPYPLHFRCPRWRGEPLEGRRILLYAEQGLGDAIQFCRYAAMVAARGGEVILQVHPPVKRLMHSLGVVRSGMACVAQLGEEPPAFDLECPLMSLPVIFGTTMETVPWPGPYLAAAADQFVHHLPQASAGAGLRVGVVWAGNPKYKADRFRSMKLRTLTPLLRNSDVQWFSLQKGAAASQISELPEDVHLHDGASKDRDLADTALLIATLDLVITTDTSIAHLAGAMGKPVWIMLPHLSDWRWMQDRSTTPWYPTAKLFRQSVPGDWRQVLERIAAHLNTLAPAQCQPLRQKF
jgi:tetratricopeptide (TPR) repeat protein